MRGFVAKTHTADYYILTAPGLRDAPDRPGHDLRFYAKYQRLIGILVFAGHVDILNVGGGAQFLERRRVA
jgi:hypothetical protein